MARKDPRLSTLPDNFNEQIQDRTIRHMLFLEGLKTRQARDIDNFIVTDIIPDLRDQLAARLARIEGLVFDTGPVTTQRIEAQISALENISQRFNRDLRAMVQGELFDIAQDEARWTVGMIRSEAGTAGPAIEMILPAAEQIRSAVENNPFDGKVMADWFSELAENTQRRLSAEIRRGIVQGRTIDQHVRAVVGTRSSKFTDGILQISRKNAEAIARTAVAHSARTAKAELWKQNERLIKGEKWVATLDSRTCLVCSPLDGKVLKLDEPPFNPLHFNCRCIRTPILKSWRELGIPADEPQFEKFRASANGKVPADLTYNKWLKNQSADVQNIALGDSRAKLFREGGLDVKDFVSRDMKVKTLDDVRKLEADAFDRADL